MTLMVLTPFSLLTTTQRNPPIQDIVLRNWPTLGRSSATKPLVNAKIIFGRRRPPNLKDNLICSRLPPGPDDITPDWPTCKSGARCRHCPRLNNSAKITSHSTGRSFTSTFSACCQSKNLIYCISCTLCSIQYVGQTITPLMTRINNHLSTIRTKKIYLYLITCRTRLTLKQYPLGAMVYSYTYAEFQLSNHIFIILKNTVSMEHIYLI